MTKRLRRMMVARKNWLALALVAGLAAGMSLTRVVAVHGQTASSAASPAPQAAPASQNAAIAGTWQGTLQTPNGGLRIVAKFTNDGGTLRGTMYSIDQGGQPIPASSASFADGTLKFAISAIDGKYEGKLGGDGKSIAGSWTQGGGNPLPLVLVRATPETEWAIPEPRPEVPAMPASAHPGVEVATIKPASPDERRKGFIWNGRELQAINYTLSDLICTSYNLQPKQIANEPDWMTTEKFDITVQPDMPGRPSLKQSQGMARKLMADRFQLKVHQDKKEMAAFVLTVVGEPKMTKNTGDPNAGEGLFFGPIGTLHVRNAPMGDFAQLLQSALLDRPVVDQTGLDGRWDFTLKWTPDEAQFAAMGSPGAPPSSDAADAGPPLITAMREQLGLKLEAEKTPVEILVIDHVDHPSPN